MFARFLSVVSAALVLAAALPALAADDAPLPPLTPKGEYLVMTQDDATSSSKCIGNPATPICAVETVMACWVRGRDDLCRIGMGLRRNPGLFQEPGADVIFQIMRSEILAADEFPWTPEMNLPWRPGEIEMRAGDVRVDTVPRNCDGELSPAACHPPILGTITYIVRRQGDAWAVIVWRGLDDPRDE